MPAPFFTQHIPGTDLSFDMILVKGGSFLMGSNDKEADNWEKPVHPVTVANFYMAKYPVTQGLWKAMMGNNPSYFQGDQRPVEQISWDNAQAFIKKLNEKTILPAGALFRLPSEAEWEFAARGGNASGMTKYAGSNKLKESGWYSENSYHETKPVGVKFPNELGLYDMSGNVHEWCNNVWQDNYERPPDDGAAWVRDWEQARRVIRGGSWFSIADHCRGTFRYHNISDKHSYIIGFRLAR